MFVWRTELSGRTTEEGCAIRTRGREFHPHDIDHLKRIRAVTADFSGLPGLDAASMGWPGHRTPVRTLTPAGRDTVAEHWNRPIRLRDAARERTPGE